MTTPVKTYVDYVVCFEAQPEHISARHHFIKECGWTESQFRKIKHFPFFCAKVSIWKFGELLASDYLGACCYRTEKEFYTTKGCYFDDMVMTCAKEINDPELIKAISCQESSSPAKPVQQ